VVAYFYFTFADVAKQTKDGFLRSVIRQLCGSRPDIPGPVSQLYHHPRKQNHEPDQKSLQRALRASMEGFSHVFMVVDGLDEAPTAGGERSGLVELLLRIREWELPSLHLLITSRFDPELDRGLHRAMGSGIAEVMDLDEQKEVGHDIETFVASALAAPAFEDWPGAMVAEATTKLVEKSKGM